MAEPMSEARLTEIRDLNVDSCSADAPYNPDVWALETARMELLAEVDHLKRRIAAIGRMNEVADGDWRREVDRLKAERDSVAESAKHMGSALSAVGLVIEQAIRTAVSSGDRAGMSVLIDYMSDADMLPATAAGEAVGE
ncbi:hypothetical protein ACIBHX_01630 [Nonomuraea sp. NPDC050536]|uniref:hypothetical protein n=1 Tax=Nonomuraea sp. NPDC050536 TaxID=3364366 RepID=UPI0037CC4621